MIYGVVCQTGTNNSSTQILELKREVSVEGKGQHGFKKHAVTGFFVMFHQATDGRRGKDARIMRVKTEPVIQLFDPRM